MKETYAIFAVALCAVVGLLGSLINLVLLTRIAWELAQWHRCTGEANAGTRRRIEQMAAFMINRFGWVEKTLNEILRKEEAMTDQEQQLTDAVKRAADEEASLEERVDGLIAALKQPHDSPIVAQAIADLEALKSREAGFEVPPPPPPPAATDESA
jgi:hypothetical protein